MAIRSRNSVRIVLDTLALGILFASSAQAQWGDDQGPGRLGR